MVSNIDVMRLSVSRGKPVKLKNHSINHNIEDRLQGEKNDLIGVK